MNRANCIFVFGRNTQCISSVLQVNSWYRLLPPPLLSRHSLLRVVPKVVNTHSVLPTFCELAPLISPPSMWTMPSRYHSRFLPSLGWILWVYYESIKRERKSRPIYEWRCDERLKTKAEGSTRLAYTGLLGGLEHIKIERRLIDERFASVMGECVTLTW
jgi:hypothetical protein